jgi:glyoxylase-like metal-dependent hydrolase (beta-lactamase superfamily II)
MISLEDSYQDILSKAMRGLGLSADQVAASAGVSAGEVIQLREGSGDVSVARKVAPVLNLDPEKYAVSVQDSWAPQPVEVKGLYQFRNEEGMAPNFYLAFDAESRTAIAFDTGDDASEMIAAIDSLGCGLAAICLTHTHRDHINALGSLRIKHPLAAVYVGELEPLNGVELVSQGQVLNIGGLTLECRLTKGHSVGGITYVITGLAKPVAIVGDALFAGSMGGGMISWGDALETNRKQIFTLADDTVLCPGHGPMTTVAEEKSHNPFYPEFR